MTPCRTHRLVALALSLVMTFTVFSGVTSLASPEHAQMWLVQADNAPWSRG